VRLVRTAGSPLFRLFCDLRHGEPLALANGVIWFMEREDAFIVCEIRRAVDDEQTFEFEIADGQAPRTRRFESAGELITNYLVEQSRLLAAGWRPRSVSTLE
jgi:hypothetical protein